MYGKRYEPGRSLHGLCSAKACYDAPASNPPSRNRPRMIAIASASRAGRLTSDRDGNTPGWQKSRASALRCLVAMLLGLSFSGQPLSGQSVPSLRVDEASMRASFEATGVVVSIPVTNAAPGSTASWFRLELLDPGDTVVSAGERQLLLSPGRSAQAIHLAVPGPDSPGAQNDRVSWRLRYAAGLEGTRDPITKGMVALGAIAPDLFALRIAHGRYAVAGTDYRAHVHAINPVTRQPVAGVAIRAALSIDGGGQSAPCISPRATDATGETVVRCSVPASTDNWSRGELAVDGSKGPHRKLASADIEVVSSVRGLLSTDKPLYQPGQALHARLLMYDVSKRPVPATPVRFTLYDPVDSVALRAMATTNSFGIASIDWQLPESLRLGDYWLRADNAAAHDSSEEFGRSVVRVSRYDLPTFSVTAALDRKYYLPGQQADIEVTGTYLFGKPVTGGTVRLVRQVERRWDYSSQQWKLDEADSQVAQLNEHGRARFTVDLTAAHALQKDWFWRQITDLTYAAYVTDTSTGRTEQRRFTVRASREPIQLYLSGQRRVGDTASFYVTAFYADGSPAVVRLQIGQKGVDGATRVLRTLETNRYGVAIVSRLGLIAGSSSNRPMLVLEARDRSNAYVRREETFWGREQVFDVSTNRTVYRPGEPIIVSIRGGESSHVVLDIVRDHTAVWSTRIRLKQGRGFAVIPYQERFKGVLQLAAYSYGPEGRPPTEAGGSDHAIIYPHDTDLRVGLRTDRRTYTPGQTLTASLRVGASDGIGVPSALGVTVVDKAVDERARTDEEFGRRSVGFWNWDWWRDPTDIGGITLQSLNRLELTKEVPKDLDEGAEALLNCCSSFPGVVVEEDDYLRQAARLFRQRVERGLKPLRDALQAADTLPSNDREMAGVYARAAIPAASLEDPWGMPVRLRYGLEVGRRTITATSAGPDKQFETDDDFVALSVRWNYFTPTGAILDRVVKGVYARTGGFVRDVDTLRSELGREGVPLDTLRNPWGETYTFEFSVLGASYKVIVRDRGVPVWTSPIDYFADARVRLDKALVAGAADMGHMPRSDEELDRALHLTGFAFRDMRDPWRHAYFATFGKTDEYADEIVYSPEAAWRATPVSRTSDYVWIWTAGPDGLPGTWDDVRLFSATRVAIERRADGSVSAPNDPVPLAGGTGAISGTVRDTSGGVMPGVSIVCRREQGSERGDIVSGADGKYVLRGLASGIYRLEARLAGFRSIVVRSVPVTPGATTSVDLVLTVGGIAEAVEVSALASVVATQSSATTQTTAVPAAGATRGRDPMPPVTPRVRDYFPETLYWAPSIVTSALGAASITFTLADTITTWKMGVIASAATGEIGYAETEVQAFQPFFAEHDPPKVLTVGDRIDLPVVVRNYLPDPQQARVELKPAPWFSTSGATTQTVSIPAGGSGRAIFPFRATTAVDAGRQQVTATSRGVADAIERPVHVHPDGLEQRVTTAGLLRGPTTLDVLVPTDVIDTSLRSSIRIYPDLIAHVVEGIEGGLERPHGCGEQTISAAYPSVLLLKYYKTAGKADSTLAQRARRYAQVGLDRLLTYRSADGGFGYWGPRDSDIALTAYAARFLADVSPLIPVDEEIIAGSVAWLVSRQQSDGTWPPRYGDGENVTASVAAVLARISKHFPALSQKAKTADAITRALATLQKPREPYATALTALAAIDTGMSELARAATTTLKAAAHREGAHAYWALETNTPFFGWGIAGRLESTALAITALAAVDGVQGDARPLVDAGIEFLLLQKDAYGVWHSGQATVHVLEALLGQLRTENAGRAARRVTVTINGQPGPTLDFPSTATASGPVTADLTRWMHPGANTISVDIGTGAPHASVHVVSSYYVPWTGVIDGREVVQKSESRTLRLGAQFDRTSAQVGDAIRCTVDVERVGHRGYGMLLAEVGLPPGAEVDRASIDRVMEASPWSVLRYEVQPDRVVFYLWPTASGTTFTFAFRPRLALEAKAAASVVYDYYNPEARAVLPPVTFTVSHAAAGGAQPRR